MIYSVKQNALHPKGSVIKTDTKVSKLEGNARLSYLCDFYGELLTERQRELAEYYWGDDLSLAEIAEITSISRQGVRASLEKTKEALTGYEEKLGLAERFSRAKDISDRLCEELVSESPDITALRNLSSALSKLYE